VQSGGFGRICTAHIHPRMSFFVQRQAEGVGFLVICLRLRLAVKRIMLDNLCMGADPPVGEYRGLALQWRNSGGILAGHQVKLLCLRIELFCIVVPVMAEMVAAVFDGKSTFRAVGRTVAMAAMVATSLFKPTKTKAHWETLSAIDIGTQNAVSMVWDRCVPGSVESRRSFWLHQAR